MKKNIELLKFVAPGFAIVILVGAAALFLSLKWKTVDPLFASFIIGIGVRLFMGEKFVFWPGFGFAQDFFIPAGIILYATRAQWNLLAPDALAKILLPLAASLLVLYFFLLWPAQKIGVKKDTAFLVWAACALLGPIAVVILCPILEISDEEVSFSLFLAAAYTVVMLLVFHLLNLQHPGILSGIIFPFPGAAHVFLHGDRHALQDSALLFSIKVILLGPIAFSIYLEKKSGAKKPSRLPLFYVAAFIYIGILFSFVPFLKPYSVELSRLGRILLTLAMAGVGLLTSVRSFWRNLSRPFAFNLVLCALGGLGALFLSGRIAAFFH